MAVFSKLEKFDGTGDLKSWLQKFNRCCLIAGKTENEIKGKLVMLSLSGQALAVAEQLEYERDGEQTFPQVRLRLESVFDTSAGREQKMMEFETRIQNVDESVDEFMLSLVQLYRSANPNTPDNEFQKAIKRKFLQCVSPELRRAIFVYNSDPHSNIVNYQRLLEYARSAKLNLVTEQPPAAVNVINSASEGASAISAQSNSNEQLLQAINNLSDKISEHLTISQDQMVNAISANHTQSNRSSGRGRGQRSGRGRGYYSGTRSRGSSQRGRYNDGNPVRCHKCNGPNHIAPHCMQKN